MRRFVLPLLAGVLLLSACDDPSNVGLGLVGGEGGEPELVRLPAAPFTVTESVREIGGATTLVLAGRVADPLLGTQQATAYVDFGDPARFGQGDLTRFRSSTVREVYLQMPRRYLYGDTTSAVAYALRSLTGEFNQIGTRTDTTITPGAQITSFTYALPDSLVRVPLPSTWVAANDTTLRSSVFPASFNGFQIAATSGNAIVGFTPGTIRMFAVSAQDTVVYTANKTVTTTERLSAPALPPDYVLVQDGYPHARRVELSIGQIGVSPPGLSRLALELEVDTTLIRQAPPNFVRPRLSTLEFIGFDDEGEIVIVSNTGTACQRAFTCILAGVDDRGRMVFSSTVLTAIGRSLLLAQPSTIQGGYVRVPLESGGLGALLVRAPQTPGEPSLALTLIPTN